MEGTDKEDIKVFYFSNTTFMKAYDVSIPVIYSWVKSKYLNHENTEIYDMKWCY